MNKRQENRLTMYEGLLTLLQSNSAKAQSIDGFADAVTELSTVVTELKGKSTEVDTATTGKATTKYSAEDALVASVLPVCSALYVYGRKQKNAEIKERATVTEGKLRAMRDTELVSFGISIADLATVNVSGITPLGITAGKIADLKAKAEAYNTALGARESSVADRKGARGSMNDLFDSADELLDEEFDKSRSDGFAHIWNYCDRQRQNSTINISRQEL